MADLTIPNNLKDEQSVKRLLIQLANRVAKMEEPVESVESVEPVEPVEPTQDFTLVHRNLGTSYRDFDAAVWGKLRGYAQITALGSEFVNPPSALTPETVYTIYAHSVGTSTGGGAAQRVLIEEAGVSLSSFYRTGLTFASLITNGWTAT